MADPDHIEIVRRGSEYIAEWRRSCPEIEPVLTGADLCGLNLFMANLTRAELYRADLKGANLAGADLGKADLSHADLSTADLGWTNLSFADLSGASLRSADLSRATLYGANLSKADLSRARLNCTVFQSTNCSEANFEGANIEGCIFADVDLSQCLGLDATIHPGPSTVGIDTIFKSQGNIPIKFLRDCGVSDTLITFVPSLLNAMQPIQFYSCFISYSHADESFCKRLYSRLRDENLRVWFAPHDMQAGRKIHEQIDRAIRVHDKLLLVLSEQSMESEWVNTEIYKARQREVKEKRPILFPIRIVSWNQICDWSAPDGDTGRDMAREIREYFIPDFSNWKDEGSFESAFSSLLSALKCDVFE